MWSGGIYVPVSSPPPPDLAEFRMLLPLSTACHQPRATPAHALSPGGKRKDASPDRAPGPGTYDPQLRSPTTITLKGRNDKKKPPQLTPGVCTVPVRSMAQGSDGRHERSGLGSPRWLTAQALIGGISALSGQGGHFLTNAYLMPLSVQHLRRH